jgi:hypothetical protein
VAASLRDQTENPKPRGATMRAAILTEYNTPMVIRSVIV